MASGVITRSQRHLVQRGLVPVLSFLKKHRSNSCGMMMSPSTRIGLVELARWERKQSHCTDKALSPPSIRVCESYISPCSQLTVTFPPAFHGQKGSRQAGNLTPRTMNSLSAIAGHEGDEEDWESEMRGFQNDDEVSHCLIYIYILHATGDHSNSTSRIVQYWTCYVSSPLSTSMLTCLFPARYVQL